MKIGYTTGVFDLFHIGHLNLLKNASSMCDRLIVGVTTDELVKYKNKKAVIPFEERLEIIRNLKCVSCVIPQEELDKFEAWKKLKFDFLFVGDDWHNHSRWEEMEKKFKEVGVKIIYLPYTKNTSSTLINEILKNEREKYEETALNKEKDSSSLNENCITTNINNQNNLNKYSNLKEEYLNKKEVKIYSEK